MEHFQSMEQLKQSLVSYIAKFYNPIRPALTTMAFLQIKWKTAILLISLVHFIEYSPYPLIILLFGPLHFG